MIDWITCRLPVRLAAPVHDGQTVMIDRAGNIQGVIHKRLKVPGSFSSSLMVRAPSTSELEISGNVAKWLQGHNLYGPDCPITLLWAALERLAPLMGWNLSEIGLEGPHSLAGGICTRIDTTEMLTLPSLGAVKSWLRTAYATGSVQHRGRGVMRGDTVVFGDAAGKSFARWQIVTYSKGQEVQVHPLPDLMGSDPEVMAWVAGQLRAEVRLGRLELEKRGLRSLAGWMCSDTGAHSPEGNGAAREAWKEKMALIQFSDVEHSEEQLAGLSAQLVGVYFAWKGGSDLRALYSRPTFYRHRAALRAALGVDIAVPPPKGPPTAEVVPLFRRLEPVLSGRPPWADRIDQMLAAEGCAVFSLPAA